MDKNLFNDTTQGLLEAVSIKKGFFTAKKTDEIPGKIKVLTYLNDDEQRKTSQKYKDILNTFIGNSKEKESFVKRLQNIPESYLRLRSPFLHMLKNRIQNTKLLKISWMKTQMQQPPI